ncbi:hypothetical protein RJ55_02200 [Drechmeria coniospora]|nr:hypothetical protein RJ55_02200 [Drechmeria coniospora]
MMAGGVGAGGPKESRQAAGGPSSAGNGARQHRKFFIQSTFGNPRERRSRKNRPCDACRRRKTACVITSEPPCMFCESRGIVCRSTPSAPAAPDCDGDAAVSSTPDQSFHFHLQPQQHHQHQQPQQQPQQRRQEQQQPPPPPPPRHQRHHLPRLAEPPPLHPPPLPVPHHVRGETADLLTLASAGSHEYDQRRHAGRDGDPKLDGDLDLDLDLDLDHGGRAGDGDGDLDVKHEADQDRELDLDVGSPTTKSSSSFGIGAMALDPRHAASSRAEPTYNGQAAALHHNLVYHSSPSTVDLEPPPPPSSDVSSSLSVASPKPVASTQSLEDVPGRCAYFMGPTAEQDGFLLDAFRYGILSEKFNLDANIAQVHSGSAMADDNPIHFLFLEIGHPEHVNRDRQSAADHIESKVWPYGPNLVRLYFRHVHPVFPIASKVRFLRKYHDDKNAIPACMRAAVYALASVFWQDDPTLRGSPRPFPQHEMVDYAHRALRREIENPNLFVLQACLLLIHITPPAIDSMEAPTTWTMAAQATACAQVIGLHQDPGRWNINPTEQHLRRKLWWATFYTDCWSSICHGNPPHISATSYNTSPLAMADVRCDEEVPADLQHLVEPGDADFEISTGARFLEMIHIARSLRSVLYCSFQVSTAGRTMSDSLQAQLELANVQARLRDWPSLIPSCLILQKEERKRSPVTSFNCPLHLSFYAAQVILYRALMHPPTRAARSTPGSNLRKWFPEALATFEAFAEFFSCVNKHDLFGFWGRHARSHLILCGNFLVFLFLLAWDSSDIERAYRMLESFHSTVHALWDEEYVEVKALLRVAIIRIDSFFSQAAQIMRNGGEASFPSLPPVEPKP